MHDDEQIENYKDLMREALKLAESSCQRIDMLLHSFDSGCASDIDANLKAHSLTIDELWDITTGIFKAKEELREMKGKSDV